MARIFLRAGIEPAIHRERDGKRIRAAVGDSRRGGGGRHAGMIVSVTRRAVVLNSALGPPDSCGTRRAARRSARDRRPRLSGGLGGGEGVPAHLIALRGRKIRHARVARGREQTLRAPEENLARRVAWFGLNSRSSGNQALEHAEPELAGEVLLAEHGGPAQVGLLLRLRERLLVLRDHAEARASAAVTWLSNQARARYCESACGSPSDLSPAASSISRSATAWPTSHARAPLLRVAPMLRLRDRLAVQLEDQLGMARRRRCRRRGSDGRRRRYSRARRSFSDRASPRRHGWRKSNRGEYARAARCPPHHGSFRRKPIRSDPPSAARCACGNGLKRRMADRAAGARGRAATGPPGLAAASTPPPFARSARWSEWRSRACEYRAAAR